MTYASTSREEVARLQAEFLNRGGKVQHCPKHATGTGNIRYNFAKRRHSQTHDYVIWAVSADGKQFSERVEKVKDVDAAEEAFMSLYEDARIQQVHEVR